MILEVAILHIKENQSNDFEKNYELAKPIISRAKGYRSHQLKKCIETADKYILIVEWNTLEDHEIGFRKSKDFLEWKALVHPFLTSETLVEHYA
jgi:heme-degrading monooxygenase HmoA